MIYFIIVCVMLSTTLTPLLLNQIPFHQHRQKTNLNFVPGVIVILNISKSEPASLYKLTLLFFFNATHSLFFSVLLATFKACAAS